MPVNPSKFAHVVYRTRRFEEMLAWYQAAFGAEILYQDERAAFLTYDDDHHRFALMNMTVLDPDGSGPDDRGPIGVDHVGYTYASLEDLLGNYLELKAHGILPYWSVHHGITASLYYVDPDGNPMEFQVDAFDERDDAAAFMQHNFETNIVGVEFDPDDWIAKLKAGVPANELRERSVHEPVSPVRRPPVPVAGS